MITEKQYIQWKYRARDAYKAGKLSIDKIKKIETIPGWKWESINGKLKSEALTQCEEVFSRAKTRGKLPNRCSENIQEKQDAQWIRSKKKAKQGRAAGYWFPEFEEIASKYGFKDAFSDLKSKALTECEEIFERAKIRGFLPKNGSKDTQEAKDARWLSNKKMSRQGGGNGVLWHPEFEEIAAKHGFKDIFEYIDRKSESLAECEEIFKRAKARGFLPKNGSKNTQENQAVN